MATLDGLNLESPGAKSSSSSGASGARLLRPKAQARPVQTRREDPDVPPFEREVPESDLSSQADPGAPTSGGSAKQRRPTPAARRVKWHDLTAEDVSRDQGQADADEDTHLAETTRAPRDALSAMRTLASLPEATPETTRLLDQLEAHLAATTAAAE